MKNSRLIYFASMLFLLLNSCAETDLEKLEKKKESLREELTEVIAAIKELDTIMDVYIPLVSIESVELKDFEHRVEVQGAVETDKNAIINAEASGTIRNVHVKEGQKVSQGQALITIDATILSSQIDEIETQLELANYMFDKQKKLMEEGLGTEMEYEQARTQKKSLESTIKTMKSQQGKTTVRAPFSGTIDQVMVSLGELASPGIPLLRLVDNRDVKVTASLSESLLMSVDIGTDVELLVPSLNDTVIKTKITSKGNFIDPVNRTFRIRIDIKNNKLLLPNQLAKVQVTNFVRDSAIVINTQAILQDTKNNTYIYKLGAAEEDGFKVEKVFVEVVSRYKGEACIVSLDGKTLTATDKIVVNGAKGITEADIVTIQ